MMAALVTGGILGFQRWRLVGAIAGSVLSLIAGVAAFHFRKAIYVVIVLAAIVVLAHFYFRY